MEVRVDNAKGRVAVHRNNNTIKHGIPANVLFGIILESKLICRYGNMELKLQLTVSEKPATLCLWQIFFSSIKQRLFQMQPYEVYKQQNWRNIYLNQTWRVQIKYQTYLTNNILRLHILIFQLVVFQIDDVQSASMVSKLVFSVNIKTQTWNWNFSLKRCNQSY